MVEVPAKFAELIAEQFKVQCSYVDRGCKECIVFKVRNVLKGMYRFQGNKCLVQNKLERQSGTTKSEAVENPQLFLSPQQAPQG